MWTFGVLFLPILGLLRCFDGIYGATKNLTIGLIVPNNDKYDSSLFRVLPVVRLAIKHVQQNRSILPDWHINVTYKNLNECSATYGPLNAIDMRDEVQVFFGPTCSYDLAPVVRYTFASWDIPVLSSAGRIMVFDNKTEYSLLTRMHGFYGQLVGVLSEIFSKFHWNTIGLLYSDHLAHKNLGRSDCYFAMEPIFHMMSKRTASTSKNPFTKSFDESNPSMNYHPLLEEMVSHARIIILCAPKENVRKLMIEAEKLGLTDSGEYVILNIVLSGSAKDDEYIWFDKKDSEENNTRARKGFEAVLTIRPRTPPGEAYRTFSSEVKALALKYYNYRYKEDQMVLGSSWTYVRHLGHISVVILLNITTNSQFGIVSYLTYDVPLDLHRPFSCKSAELNLVMVRENIVSEEFLRVNPEAASFYEAVILYVTALSEALKLGHSPTDGSVIHALMRNRTLPGIDGNFTIDGNNDRHADFSILDMEPTYGLLKEVAVYHGAEKTYVDVPFAEIHWAGGRLTPPADEPLCGFDGAKCAPILTTAAIVAIVLSILLVMVALGAFFSYRHYKKEAELAMMTWLLKYEDLRFGSKDQLRRTDSRQSLLKMRDDVSVDTLAMGETRKQIFAPTAYYKKQLCAVKKLNAQQIVLSRPLLKEFKVIQTLQHDHVTRFIGACFDSEPPCLLFEYCPKGSLEDILENEEIELDWMFRYSLMHDLMKGMAYIHSSELKTHGNLKSSNCVVDSRFVLKITDYGPHCMRSAEDVESSDSDAYAHWKRKLWTAPELLRLREFPHSGTQKGDVYSFAIIAQEIVYRKGPFYVDDDGRTPGPKGIVRKVIEARPIPFRPTLEPTAADESLVAMIEKAWSEDPNIRPDFTSLRNLIRRLNKENESGNLLDNLLQRMEQYANNLESLVAERTSDYLEQKRKAEELLYQLLPRPVAGQLIKGEPVTAESYDSVTIYFSDIVGFTTISATSTPFQVVNFLNDLYTCFDAITEHFDVYKVETIGDAYVVVSGLPVRNGALHAREIARMSLRIIEEVKRFKIRHRPGDALRVRIGMHTGPCVAGVVGLKMPRYCLFGDTVNTASRMESNSLPLRIHCSEVCKNVLDKFGTFDTELRGELDVKGKGRMTTYWLNGEREPPVELTSPTASTIAVPTDLRHASSLSTIASQSPQHFPIITAMTSPHLESYGDAPDLLLANGLKPSSGNSAHQLPR